MRKLVALVLVLAMAPLASAGMLAFVGGEGVSADLKVQAGSTFTINLVASDVTTVSYFAFTLAGSGDGLNTVTLGTMPVKWQNSTWSSGTSLDGSAANLNVWGKNVKGYAGMNGPYGTAGEVLYSFTAKANSNGTITFDDYKGAVAGGLAVKSQIGADGVTSEVFMNPLTLTVIPEPATMALLGLGGLLFARRK